MDAAMVAQVQQAVQQTSGAQQGQAAGNGTLQGTGAQQTGGGMFAALLQQMLGGGNGQSPLLNVGPQQKAMLMEQMRKQLGDEGAELGMQLLAEMLAVNPGLIQQVNTSELAELLGQTAQGTQAGMQGATAAQTAMQNLAAAQELQAAATGTASTGAAGTNVFAAQLAAQEAVPGQSMLEQVLSAQAKQAGSAGGSATELNALRQAVTQTVQVSADTAQSGTAQDDGLTGQAQFQRAMFQAQQKLTVKDSDVAELAGELGVSKEKKEAEVKTDNVVPFPTQVKLEQLGGTKELTGLQVDAKDLLQQVKTGLTEGMHSGKNEFVIKLKPDGMGEITVRMLEDAGKITMSITTANAQTQRMLNNEIAALRDAVRPYNVEVQHVENQNAQHFDLNQQRQSFAQQQGQQNRHPQQQGQNWYPGYDYGEEPEPEQTALRYASSGLNTVV